ncbi:flagellar associated protein 253 [Dorcoceras hygrometricum]|uniref:Flagellar associated protein 253 n=1 Tax=Dorcoceras hygrometricum TaxID=472368 RepID=A0A2Z7CUS0_9LAMI|nr:flagellar associated protein 253 [Dorcoceras hygrometricum]
MSLFDLQDVCMVIGSLATLDLPMVVDLIGIYVFKGPYCTLTMTDWFLQALSVIPRGSWGDVARRFTMIRWASPKMWKVPLEDLLFTSCTDPIPQPAAARTPRLHQPSAVTHLFYAYVRKVTNTEFNVVVLGRDLILVCDSLANQFRTSLKICE